MSERPYDQLSPIEQNRRDAGWSDGWAEHLDDDQPRSPIPREESEVERLRGQVEAMRERVEGCAIKNAKAMKPLPCPYCGRSVDDAPPLWKHKTKLQCVQCLKCDLHGPMVRGRDSAVFAWNQIADTDRAEKAERERDTATDILETILIEVEPVRHDIRRRIDAEVSEAQRKVDAGELRGNGNEPWVFSAELRMTLQRPYEKFEAAIRAGNELLDARFAAIRKAAGLEPPTP